jgi:hypothetical protein
MGYCTNCGAELKGQFCMSCGQAAGAGTPPSHTAEQTATAPSPKKRGILPYVLIGCLGVIVLGAITTIGMGLFVAKKVSDAGLDPELMRRNPAAAAAKLVAALNPDLEVVNVNEARGIVTVKEKSTGRVFTLNFEDIKTGRLVFEEEGKGKIEIEGEGGAGTTARFPRWLPAYPAIEKVSLNATSDRGGVVIFSTNDAVETVARFYDEAFRGAGMKVSKSTTEGDGVAVTLLTGSKGDTDQCNVTITRPEEVTQVTVQYK